MANGAASVLDQLKRIRLGNWRLQSEGRTAGESGVTQVRVAAQGSAEANRSEVVNLRRFGGIFAQLLVLLLLVYRFQIENQAFLRMTTLVVAGFSVHYFLPFRFRLPFFVLLSLIGICVVLGVPQGIWLVALGLVIIAVCHLPISLVARVGILLAVGCVLAFPRWGIGRVPWSPAIWPLLGSMFIFRVIIFLYDRHHEAGRPRLSQTLAYFFLLPNVCFPLFPVVDFKKFCLHYFDEERHAIYQVGVEWMWRGLIQLLVYRLVYYQLTLDSVDVSNVGDLVVYMLSTLFLYVRISGHFHLVIGMLHLFGFNLPETNHRYFLASSFTDFWRRINIYWKDFMMKVFYYPAFFRLRRFGDTKALVLATLFTFIVTWFLHVVQWFWIRGSIFVEWNDVIFWSVFGLLVLANSLYEAKHGRTRTLSKRTRTLRESAGLVLRTMGTFVVICILWSFWASESVSDWLLMSQTAFTLPDWSRARFVAVFGVVGLGGMVAVFGVWRGWGRGRETVSRRRAPALIFATSVALCLLTLPEVTRRLGGEGGVVDLLQAASLNRRDAEEFQRGYYENLLDVNKFNDELWRIYDNMPNDFVRSLSRLGLSRSTGDEQDYELVPHREGRFVGIMVRTNQWGMRDKDYSRSRPGSSYRMAVLGPSTAMGSGVEASETFDTVLEDRLNRENSMGSARTYEVLNFGVAGYSSFHVLYQLERKVFSFEPNMILYIGHQSEVERAARQFIRMVQKGIVPPDAYLTDFVRRTGLRADMKLIESRRRIKPYARELLAWVFGTMVAKSRERQIHPVFVYMETVTEPTEPFRAADRAEVLAIARQAGFVVVDLTGAYKGHPPASLWISENDGHPNALGSRLLADRLYAGLREKRSELSLHSLE